MSLLSAAISLPAMSKEVKLLNVSYGADGHPATFGSKLRLISPGVPKGNKNAFKHGRYTAEEIANRREITGTVEAFVIPE